MPRYVAAKHEPDLVEISLGKRLPVRDVRLLIRRDLIPAKSATPGRLNAAISQRVRIADGAFGTTPSWCGYELVCDPQNEAAIYAQALTLNLWPWAGELGGPIALIGCVRT